MELTSTIVVRGGGDIASGIIHRLHRCGYRLLILETDRPTSIRRAVSFSEAVYDGETTVEGVTAVHIEQLDGCRAAWKKKLVPVLIDPWGECLHHFNPLVLIDAILAKRNYGTHKAMSELTIGVGPGFTAGSDVHTVIETARGHNLGKIILNGSASANSGIPGSIDGYTSERVIYADRPGCLSIQKKIGSRVKRGDPVATIDSIPVTVSIDGLIRGMIRDQFRVEKGLKIIDIDPRTDQPDNCFTISDKARCISGSVLEVLVQFMKR